MAEITELHIDLGNTRGKWRLLHGGQRVAQGTVDPNTGRGLARLDSLDIEVIKPIQVILASVAKSSVEAHLRSVLRDYCDCMIETLYTQSTALGLFNCYASPDRMGEIVHLLVYFCVYFVSVTLSLSLLFFHSKLKRSVFYRFPRAEKPFWAAVNAPSLARMPCIGLVVTV